MIVGRAGLRAAKVGEGSLGRGQGTPACRSFPLLQCHIMGFLLSLYQIMPVSWKKQKRISRINATSLTQLAPGKRVPTEYSASPACHKLLPSIHASLLACAVFVCLHAVKRGMWGEEQEGKEGGLVSGSPIPLVLLFILSDVFTFW